MAILDSNELKIERKIMFPIGTAADGLFFNSLDIVIRFHIKLLIHKGSFFLIKSDGYIKSE